VVLAVELQPIDHWVPPQQYVESAVSTDKGAGVWILYEPGVNSASGAGPSPVLVPMLLVPEVYQHHSSRSRGGG
jgi:hypothetical protein